MRGRSGIGRRAVLAGAGTLVMAARPAFGFALGPSTKATPEFIEALIKRMTVKEKAGQLSIMASAIGGGAATRLNPPSSRANVSQQLADAKAGRLTGIFNGAGSDWHRRLQQAAMRSRLRIPMLFAADVIHGFRTVFPVPLGEAASFDPELARRTARAAAVEASAAGIDLTFAPMVDIARDARWGRGVEASGEDVLVGCRFAAARVAGFQGRSISADDAVAACAKHFAAYGAGEAGLDYNSVDVSERTLRQVYFPPFQAAFDAGAAVTMAAFNEISGIPATANHWLLSDVLRGEWNFRGLVVSDYTADEELIAAGYARNGREAARLAFLAGVDMSMESGLYFQHLPALVASGAVPMERLDEAVRRVLALKAALGLFDDPFRRLVPGRERARVLTPDARKLSREAGARSVVLLRNEDDLLPLRSDGGQKIALIGPFAQGAHDLIGPWNVYGDDAQAVDLATGLGAAMRDPTLLKVARGSGVETAIPGGIAEAVAVAQMADIVLLALGESEEMSGEAQSRTEVVLPAPQQALADAVAATGKPVIVLLKNGRALALEGSVLTAQAILVTWFLGSETGNALADVLFGRVAPSGRLPVSFPRESGQEPYHYDHKPTGRPAPAGPRQPYKAQYRSSPNEARFPFGHGLTYGRIVYTGLDMGKSRLSADTPLTVTARIANRGTWPADEVVQLYVRDRSASITQPVRRLIDFRRVAVAVGESEEVRFTIRREDLLFVGPDLKPTVEPGWFDIWVAPSAADGLEGSFELVE
ncbi:glycoside hydrolase family 3 N-terminal domain-containing protein [Sphingomonas sp. PR090111-T3T-6A]|uniref:glycoside hydrolase family 3 N-terminal domain-containing protein n=1 Tax=Sphingomonas sp. PR090111-T3T-6A TaxID=685778 RepID=UPI00035D198B|nr:glycoside hydrolase family 3 N-terminal domain-containing protein [Sphingomonas sp. PR090111-T3T-6A]